jgi:hypothetical protein
MPSANDPATRATYWQQHIQHWKNSQLSQIAYCREHKLNFHRFNYWLRKEDPIKAKKSAAVQSSSFVPVIKHQAVHSEFSRRYNIAGH